MDVEPAVEVIQNGPGAPFWAILVSSVVAAMIALMVVAKHRLVAKKKAAHDYIQVLWSPYVHGAEETFRELLDNDRLLTIIDAKTSDETKNKLKVQTYLNHYELLAGSIRRNILDEGVCKCIVIDDVLFANDKARILIDELRKRTNDDGFFVELEWLAERWRANPEVDKEPMWLVSAFKEISKL